ncbi:MAG TPA: OadG family protein [Firmicutes bacterium]|nr:OadG family protein [Bacillota bacterium]
MNAFIEALGITVVGISTVFAGLLILAFCIKLLERLFGPEKAPREQEMAQPGPTWGAREEAQVYEGPPGEIIAAITGSLIAAGVNPKRITIRAVDASRAEDKKNRAIA